MFLMCSVLSYFYFTSFAETGWKECCLPSALFLFTERLVIVLYGFEHNAHHGVNIMRRSCVFHVFNSQFSGDRRTYLFLIKTYALYF